MILPIAWLVVTWWIAPARAQMSSPIASAMSPNSSINVTGNEFIYDIRRDMFIVRGDAHVVQQNSLLDADELEYLRREHEVVAIGHVKLDDKQTQIYADRATVDQDSETAVLDNAKVVALQGRYFLTGRKIRKLLGQHYIIENGYFTTCGCEPGAPSWSIGARVIDAQMGGTATIQDATVNILGHPIFDLPYVSLPASNNRKTGLLAARSGVSGLRGFQYFQPFFLNLGASQDATVALDVETAQRIGGLAEYRIQTGPQDYLKVTGAFFDESIRSQQNRKIDIIDPQLADPVIPVDRYGIIGRMQQHLTDNLLLYGSAVSVSDSLYLREMNLYTLSGRYAPPFLINRRDATSQLGLLQTFANSFLRLQGVWSQDLIQPQSFALQELPDLLYSGRKSLLGGLIYSDFDVEASEFWREQGVQGRRLDINPRFTLPWRLSDYVYGWETLGLRETLYNASGHNINVIPAGTNGRLYNNGLSLGGLVESPFSHRELIYGESGIATILERVYSPHWGTLQRLKNTIEPMLTYDVVPQVNQNNLPLFDQVDRVNARSMFTGSITTRLFAERGSAPSVTVNEDEGADDPNSNNSSLAPIQSHDQVGGKTVTQIASINYMQVYDTSHIIAPNRQYLSDGQLTATLLPDNWITVGSQAGFDPDNKKITYGNFFTSIRPPWEAGKVPRLSTGRSMAGGSFVQLSYNFVGGDFPSESVMMRFYYELINRLGVYYAPLYDVQNNRLLASMYGVRFKSTCDCWAIDTGLMNTYNPNQTTFQFQLTLGGIGSMGSNPFGQNPFVPSTRPQLMQAQF